MRVVWNRTQLSIHMTVDDAWELLRWLQRIGTMLPDSVHQRLRSRLEETYPDGWSKFRTKT